MYDSQNEMRQHIAAGRETYLHMRWINVLEKVVRKNMLESAKKL